jgi:hypothetical protein
MDKIRAVYHEPPAARRSFGSWMLAVDGEDGYVDSWGVDEGNEFVDALCALVMRRAQVRAARRRRR